MNGTSALAATDTANAFQEVRLEAAGGEDEVEEEEAGGKGAVNRGERVKEEISTLSHVSQQNPSTILADSRYTSWGGSQW